MHIEVPPVTTAWRSPTLHQRSGQPAPAGRLSGSERGGGTPIAIPSNHGPQAPDEDILDSKVAGQVSERVRLTFDGPHHHHLLSHWLVADEDH